MRQWFRSAARAIDLADIGLVVGVASLAYGVHQIYAPASYVIVGAVLVWLGIPERRFPITFSRGKDAH